MAPASTSSRDVRALRRLKLFNGHLNTPRILSETGPHEVSLLTAKHARCGAVVAARVAVVARAARTTFARSSLHALASNMFFSASSTLTPTDP